jgi:uncharacterized protein (UPF0333 family)
MESFLLILLKLNKPMERKKGTISLPIAAVGGIILTVLSGAAAYFTTVNAQNDKVNGLRGDTQIELGKDRERITAVETDIKTIKDYQLESRNDIKELLRRVK